MAELFEKNTDTIGLHVKNIFSTKELDKKSTTEDYSVVQMEGNRKVNRKIKFYNLDMIISVGYRVNSKRGTQFRIWATNVLKEHLIKGYTINEKRMREDRAKLTEFQKTSRIMERLLQNKSLDSTEATGLLKVILDYQKALHLLDEYDLQELEIKKVTTLALFLWFLNENDILYKEDGSKRLADNALVALTLLIAESRAEEKDIMVKVIVNLINQNN